MNFDLLLAYCKSEAIKSALLPDQASVWRKICRSYSKKFHTKLEDVEKLDPLHVLLTEFEDQLDDFDVEEDIEHILETIYELEDPEYEKSKKEELNQFIKDSEEEERERLDKGRPIHKALKDEPTTKTLVEKEAKKQENRPIGGHINMSYLEKEENPFGEFDDT